MTTTLKAPSATTAAANAFVAEHLAAATALGESLAALVGQPAAFEEALLKGFKALADPVYVEGVRRVTPGLDEIVGVRMPLMEATHKAFKRGTRRAPAAELLDTVDRLLASRYADVRWFGIWGLERLIPADPDGTWQLMRRTAAGAGEWITVDTLAHPYGVGIVRDQARWAELERLVTSDSPWERRLVGSTLATLTHVKHADRRDEAVVTRGLGLIERLMGDPAPDVQKALSWAIRSLAQLDTATVVSFARTQTEIARAESDGNRAWVLRDSLSKFPDDTAANLRAALEGLRRGSNTTSTPRAATSVVVFTRAMPHRGPAEVSGRSSAL
jgi:3-methyladenine DNA glycosylase AlkD